MVHKPAGLGPEYASQFSDRSVVDAYRYRPPHPEEVFDVLDGLLGQQRRVLDLGCGAGDIARPMAQRGLEVDAVDISSTMIETGKALPGGELPDLHWLHGRAEDVDLTPPYGIITASESLHWMDWEAIFPRIRSVLADDGHLVVLSRVTAPTPWNDDLAPIISRYSTNREFQQYGLVEELVTWGLLELVGEHRTEMIHFSQPLNEYVESWHSRNGLSRDRMTADAAAGFDREMQELVQPHCRDDLVELWVGATLIWGRPRGLRTATSG